MSNQAIDNSAFDLKVRLRMDNLPPGPVSVLDCFAGTGRIWKEVKRRSPGRCIAVTSIDKRTDLPGLYLCGDNRQYLACLDLDLFDVIDLDAYGVPVEQLEILFHRPPKIPKIVFVTMINVVVLPNLLLTRLGYSAAMIRKCPSLFAKRTMDRIRAYLAGHGVRRMAIVQVRHIPGRPGMSTKEYMVFELPGAGEWQKT